MDVRAMTQEYFHITAIKLDPGSIIQPGNWGRILRRYQRITSNGQIGFGDAWILSRELIFEMVRRQQFPDKPSRWESAFCCTTIDAAREYQAANDLGRLNLMYKVEPLDESPMHIGPLAGLNWLPNGAIFVDSYEELARFYWSGHSEGPQEIVTTSRLKVIEVIA